MQSAALIVFLCDLGQPWAADGEARRLYSAGAMARRHVSSLPMDDSARVLLGVSAVAGAAGVSGRAVRFAIDDGRLKGVRRGRVWLIHPDDARAWIASRGSRAS